MNYVDFMGYLINIFTIANDEADLVSIRFIYDDGLVVISLIEE
jgi:hypothetical protein